MEAIVLENRDLLPLEVQQARCPTVATVRIEQWVGERIVGAVGRSDLLDSSLSEVQHNVDLLAVLSRQDCSHLDPSAMKSFPCL